MYHVNIKPQVVSVTLFHRACPHDAAADSRGRRRRVGARAHSDWNVPAYSAARSLATVAANKVCLICATTPSTAAKYGPLVEGTVTIDVNAAGCIAEATGDLSASGLRGQRPRRRSVRALACEVNCPVPTGDDGTAFAALAR